MISHNELWEICFPGCSVANCPKCRKEIHKHVHGVSSDDYSWDRSHIISRYNGGTDDPWNLTVLCQTCNRSLGSENIGAEVLRNIRRANMPITSITSLGSENIGAEVPRNIRQANMPITSITPEDPSKF